MMNEATRNEIEELTPKPEAHKWSFENVAMYHNTGSFAPRRIDCRKLIVTTGVAYAQYNDAVRVEYVEKGKRTPHAFIMGYRPWIRVCEIKDAVKEPESLVPAGSAPGVTCQRSRYTSCDPRWKTDFEDATAEVRWLVSIGVGDREGDHLERCRAIDRKETVN